MSLVHKLKRRVIAFKAPKDVLMREIYYLQRAIKRNEHMMDQYQAQWCGVCCVYCEFPQLYDMEDKLGRQFDMLSHLERKVGK